VATVGHGEQFEVLPEIWSAVLKNAAREDLLEAVVVVMNL